MSRDLSASPMTARFALFLMALLAWGCGGGTGLGAPGGDRAIQISFEGGQAYLQGNFARADSTFQEALSVDPRLSDAQNGRGWANFSLASQEGDPSRRAAFLNQARENFSRAVTSDTKNADAWAGMAGAELANDNYQQAVNAAQQVLQINPNYFSLHDNFNTREIRLILPTPHFFLGKFSAGDVPDPNNAAAQVAILDRTFKYTNPTNLLFRIQELQTR